MDRKRRRVMDVHGGALHFWRPPSWTESQAMGRGGRLEIGRVDKKVTLTVGFPATNSVGELCAVVYAVLDLGWLRSLFAHSTLPPGSSVTLLDVNHRILLRLPDAEDTPVGTVLSSGRSLTKASPGLPSTNILKPAQRPIGTRVRTNPTTALGRGRDGVLRLYASTPLFYASDSAPVRVTVGIPVVEAYAPADRALRRGLLVTGTTVILIWIGGSIFLLKRVKGKVRPGSAGQAKGKGVDDQYR